MGEILPKFGIFRATYTFLVQILYKKCSDPKKKNSDWSPKSCGKTMLCTLHVGVNITLWSADHFKKRVP